MWRRGEGVKGPRKVQVTLLGRFNLRRPPASRSALHPENRSQRRLTRADDSPASNALQPLGQTDRGYGLAFTRRRGRGRGHQNELAAARKCRIGEDIELKLGAVRANRLYIVFWEIEFTSNGLDGE